ncbi:MAG: HigA family addiction module antitoxin [Chloroflexi bacterium]|nr:HigA family addiction module antitoxin [Chloroflexota bacterium]
MWEIDEDAEKMPPIHPGEILDEEFLKPLGMTKYRLAKSIGVDPRRIHAIVRGERAITAETAMLLGKFFNTSSELWMGLQSQYDLEVASERIGSKVDAVRPLERE